MQRRILTGLLSAVLVLLTGCVGGPRHTAPAVVETRPLGASTSVPASDQPASPQPGTAAGGGASAGTSPGATTGTQAGDQSLRVKPGTAPGALAGTTPGTSAGTSAGTRPQPAKPGTTTTTTAPAPGQAPAAEASRGAAQPRLAILVYHDVDEYFQSGFSITPTLLDQQVRMLKEEGYYFYTLADVERLLAGGEGLPEKGVMLAFDDGYQSFVTQVLPVAERYNVPAVCFVVTKYMTSDIFMGRPHMAPVEMRKAVTSPLLELAGHSWDGHRTGVSADGSQQPVLTHPIKHHLAPAVETQAEYEARVLHDFQKTAEILKEQGETTGLRHFTFPFTARSGDAVRLGQQAGFRYFYVGGERLVTPQSDPTAIPRVHAGAPYITAEVLRETLRDLFGRP